jgi:hypothetical protein
MIIKLINISLKKNYKGFIKIIRLVDLSLVVQRLP